MTAFARTLVLPEATPEGALSARSGHLPATARTSQGVESLEALARSAYCRMTERPIRRIAEPYAKLESTADPMLAEP